MSTIFAIIGLLVVAKLAFVIIFPVTATRIQVDLIRRSIVRATQKAQRDGK